ncbi:hypothetical protein [Streptomyces lydicus]|uniref:hypothetical protein n=1 Tax=Streptomyces lydicus TaxID=47763 RepID=UPI0036960AB5
MSGVKANPKALRTAAGPGEEMQSGLGAAVGNLNAQHQGVAGETGGFEFSGELMRTLQSWHDRLGDVKKECGEVAHSLRGTADNYEQNDEQTANAFRPAAGTSVSVRPAMQSAARYDSPFG